MDVVAVVVLQEEQVAVEEYSQAQAAHMEGKEGALEELVGQLVGTHKPQEDLLIMREVLDILAVAVAVGVLQEVRHNIQAQEMAVLAAIA